MNRTVVKPIRESRPEPVPRMPRAPRPLPPPPMLDAEQAALKYREQATQAARGALEAIADRIGRERKALAARKLRREDVDIRLARNAEELAALKPILSEARKAHVAAVRAVGSYHRKREPKR